MFDHLSLRVLWGGGHGSGEGCLAQALLAAWEKAGEIMFSTSDWGAGFFLSMHLRWLILTLSCVYRLELWDWRLS